MKCVHMLLTSFLCRRERAPHYSLRLIPPLDRVRLQILYTCHTRRIGSIAAAVCVSFDRAIRVKLNTEPEWMNKKDSLALTARFPSSYMGSGDAAAFWGGKLHYIFCQVHPQGGEMPPHPIAIMT